MPNLIIDQGRRAVYVDGQELQLSPQEYRVLHCLSRRPGELVQKNELLAAMWATVAPIDDGLTSFNPTAVDLVIFRLRKKLRDLAQNPIYLETRRGFGYILHHAQVIRGETSQVAEQRPEPGQNQPARMAHAAGSRPTLLDPDKPTPPWATLTRQEWQIFLLLGDEKATRLTNRALAQQVQMTEGTLKKHLQHIYRKLDVENRASAALLSMRVKASFRIQEHG